jgi:hypothetical protein
MVGMPGMLMGPRTADNINRVQLRVRSVLYCNGIFDEAVGESVFELTAAGKGNVADIR